MHHHCPADLFFYSKREEIACLKASNNKPIERERERVREREREPEREREREI